MKLDLPLILLNEKLPRNVPTFYIKVMLGIAGFNFLLTILLKSADVSNIIVGGIFFSGGLLMFLAYIAFLLAILYNTAFSARNMLMIYFPSLESVPAFDVAYKLVRLAIKYILVIFIYMFILLTLLSPLMMINEYL